MEGYANWVRRNKDYVQSLESLANGFTWFVPDRFASSEIGLEAVSSLLGIISVINQYIVDAAPAQSLEVAPLEPSTFPYPLCLSVVKELETLVEVIAEHYYGDDNKWNFIAITEGIKAFLRLLFFQQSGYKMLLHGGGVSNAESEDDTSDSQNKIRELFQISGLESSNLFVQKPCGLEERALSLLTQFGQNVRNVYDSTLANRMHHQVHMVNPQAVERPTIASVLFEKGVCGKLLFMGEVLHILRPFVYVMFIKKYGWRSWTPWVASLAIDLVGMFASLQATRSKRNTPVQIVLSMTEKDELKRRHILLALYVMRDPLFCKYTRKKLESTEKALKPVPIVGMFTEKLFELIFGVQSRFSYTSGS